MTPSPIHLLFQSVLQLGFGIMGAVLGMAQTWYVGVLAKKIDLPEFGGDIAFELSFSFTAVTYPVLRYIEKRYFGRQRGLLVGFSMDGVDRRARMGL